MRLYFYCLLCGDEYYLIIINIIFDVLNGEFRGVGINYWF